MPNFSSSIIMRAFISSRVMSSSSLKGLCRPGATQGGTVSGYRAAIVVRCNTATVLRSAEGARFPLAIS